jgi:hypothetical protein
MATLSPPLVALNKVVLAYLDGRRVRGRVLDFSQVKEVFRLIPENEAAPQKGQEVSLKDLKAVFFVKDFRGNSKYRDSQKLESGRPGRKVEIVFSDDEKMAGTTQGYDPKKIGFFLFPADAKSNSLRVFVVNWNVRDVKFL